MSEKRKSPSHADGFARGERMMRALLDIAPKRYTVSFWGESPVSRDGYPIGPAGQVMPQLLGVIDYDVEGDWFCSVHDETKQVVITRIPSTVRRITVDLEREQPEEPGSGG